MSARSAARSVSLVPVVVTEQSGSGAKPSDGRDLRRARSAISAQLRGTMDELGFLDLSKRLRDCGRVWVHACGECGEQAARPVYRCEFKLCPWCLLRRGLVRADELTPYVMAYRNRIHVTLTVKNGPDLAERDAHLRAAWKKLVRRQAWKLNVRRAFVFWETTFNAASGEWHPHLHIIADGWIDQHALAGEWQVITGDSRIVYVQQLRGGIEGVREACKYPLKVDQLAGSKRGVLEYMHAMSGKRQFWTYGYPRNNWRDSEKVEAATPEEEEVERLAAEALALVEAASCPNCGALDSMLGRNKGGGRHVWWDRGDVKAVKGGWYVLDG